MLWMELVTSITCKYSQEEFKMKEKEVHWFNKQLWLVIVEDTISHKWLGQD